MDKKIVTKKQIQSIVTKLRNENKDIKIVTTNGAFDLIHVGHILSFEKAKSLGDILIVGLNSDKSIKEYKSKDRPIICQAERAKIIASLEVVDFVVIFDEVDPIDFLDYIHPTIHVKSKSGYKGLEKEVIESNGGKIVLLDDFSGISTTNIVEKIRQLGLNSK